MKIAIFGLFLFLLFSLYYLDPDNRNERLKQHYSNLFLEIDDVSSINDFFYYEGRQWAEIKLIDGKVIGFGPVVEGDFNNAKKITIERFFDIHIVCDLKNTKPSVSSSFVFDLIQYLESFDDSTFISINNIRDVVENRQFVYRTLKLLPLRDQKPYIFRSNFDEYHCYQLPIKNNSKNV